MPEPPSDDTTERKDQQAMDQSERDKWGRRQEYKRRWISNFSGVLAAVTSLLVAVASVAISSQYRNVASTRSEIAYSQLRAQKEATDRANAIADQTKAQLLEIANESEALRAEIAKASRSGTAPHYATLSPADQQVIASLKSQQDDLQKRIGLLEGALMNSPEKALALPLLKEQVDSLQDHTHGDIDAVRGEINRLFGLTQWFIGLMFTIALGVLGLALNNLRRPPLAKEDKKP